MSDDDGYEYGGYFSSEDDYQEDIADHVNSLAEHTLHSPVLVNANPDFDMEYDELEYLTDEYWDGETDAAVKQRASAQPETQSTKKRKHHNQNESVDDGKQKRRKIISKAEPTATAHPTIIWKSKDESELDVPVLKVEDGEKVAVLRDWRELLDQPADEEGTIADDESQEEELKPKGNGKKKAVAHVKQSKNDDTGKDKTHSATKGKDTASTRTTRTSRRTKK